MATAQLERDTDRGQPVGPWLNTKEAAAYVGVSWDTLKAWILDVGMPHVRMGKRWKINVDTLDRYLHQDAQSRAGV